MISASTWRLFLSTWAAEKCMIPNNAFKKPLKLLHQGHCGFTKTYGLANQLYHWAGMRNDISQMIDNCVSCQSMRPSQQASPMVPKKPSDIQGAPLEHVRTDIFQFAGKHYLVVVDRFSGYPLVKQLHKTDTGAVIRKMTESFILLGWPRTMRSDGGPQYRTVLDLFCSRNNIKHMLSSAYNPRSNGLDEAAVNQVKLLLEKMRVASALSLHSIAGETCRGGMETAQSSCFLDESNMLPCQRWIVITSQLIGMT